MENICKGNKSKWCCVCQWHLEELVGIKRGKTKRPDIIICLSFKHTHTTKIKQAPFKGNIFGRNEYTTLIAAGVVDQQGNRRYRQWSRAARGDQQALSNLQKVQIFLPGKRSVYFKISHLINTWIEELNGSHWWFQEAFVWNTWRGKNLIRHWP